MIHHFTNPEKCASCLTPLKTAGIGGITHKKTEKGYISGYLCKNCSLSCPPKATKLHEWQRMHPLFETKTGSEEKSWPKPKKRRMRFIPTQKEWKAETGMSWWDYYQYWCHDKEIRQTFSFFKNFYHFCRKHAYGSKSKGGMATQMKDIKRHKQVLEDMRT